MSTLINLLPDLRQAKLREHHRRQLATGISVATWVVCGAVVALLAVYMGGQKAIIAGYTKNIGDKKDKLQQVSGLVDALTAQQHLAALTPLYKQRIYLSKFFTAYNAATPKNATVSSLSVDAQNLLTVRGLAPTLSDVAKLARALAASNVTVGIGADKANTPYFSDINITSIDNSDAIGVSFAITATMASGVTSGSN